MKAGPVIVLFVVTVPVRPGKTLISTTDMRRPALRSIRCTARPITAPGMESVNLKTAAARSLSCISPSCIAQKNGLDLRAHPTGDFIFKIKSDLFKAGFGAAFVYWYIHFSRWATHYADRNKITGSNRLSLSVRTVTLQVTDCHRKQAILSHW